MEGEYKTPIAKNSKQEIDYVAYFEKVIACPNSCNKIFIQHESLIVWGYTFLNTTLASLLLEVFEKNFSTSKNFQ